MLRLEITGATPSGNTLLRMHWSKRSKLNKYWRHQVWERLVLELRPWIHREPGCKMRVTITRIATRTLDKDNLYAGVKPLVDALKHNRLIDDDSPEHVELEVLQEIARGKPERTVITLEKIE